MPRSRSRSPKRPDRITGRRSRSRSRERRRRPRRSRSRSPPPRYRSRSPTLRRRSHSRSPKRRSASPRRWSKERDAGRNGQVTEKPPVEKPKIDEAQLAGLSEEDREMMSLMGFANFDTTKGKKVEGNNVYIANIARKRRYRQYMNRRGGFNRPLDFIA